MDHQLKSVYTLVLVLVLVVLIVASCEFLCIEERQLVKSSTKYQHVNSYELGADEHNSGEGMKQVFRSHMKIIYEDKKFGTTSSGDSPGGVGHSYGQHNEGNNAEPKNHLLGSSASSSSGATNFVTGFNFEGDIPPPLSAGVGHAIPHA